MFGELKNRFLPIQSVHCGVEYISGILHLAETSVTSPLNQPLSCEKRARARILTSSYEDHFAIERRNVGIGVVPFAEKPLKH